MRKTIKVENLSKAYQLGQFGTGTISHDLNRWWALFRGKDDPYLKIGEEKYINSHGKSDVVWSLKNLNFEVEEGCAIGVIGKNGAGKSTLLKILSQVTAPSTGLVKVKGRISSLLEVGTGFHPELTGRENIFLNGAILGMRKKEIASKFDEIVDFSGVERYIDTPVKRYSSGMYVRLAFAVAAHLESEILIVDEVLAVGDAEFQKKCLGKMGEISKSIGKTVLFVSHNMDSVRNFCKNSLILKNGMLQHFGSTDECIEIYGETININKHQWMGSKGGNGCMLKSTKIYNLENSEFDNSQDLYIEIVFEVKEEIRDLVVGFNLFSKNDEKLACCVVDDYNPSPTIHYKPGIFLKTFKIPSWTLAEGGYRIKFDLGIHNLIKLISDDGELVFDVTNKTRNGMRYVTDGSRMHNSIIRANWEIQ